MVLPAERITLAALLLVAAGACSKPPTSGEAIPWAELATGTEARRSLGFESLFAPACTTRKSDGKIYFAEGYPHWTRGSSLCRNDDCNVDLFLNNDANGDPVESPIDGHVALTVHKKGFTGGFVDEPNLENARSKTEGVTSGKTTTTSGTLAKDSLALYLSDGSAVNNRVRVRAFFKVFDHNGICELLYVGGVKATGAPPPAPPASASTEPAPAPSAETTPSAAPPPAPAAPPKSTARPAPAKKPPKKR